MPSKKGRRLFKKARSARARTQVKLIGPSPVPSKYIIKMKYVETYQQTLTAAIPNTYSWNINSIYDPNESGTGHQPYGHDTLQTMFNRYRVFACKWRVTIFPISTTSNFQMVVTPSNDNSTPSDTDQVSERPRAVTKLVNYLGGQPTVFKGKISLPRLQGQTSRQYRNNENTQAQFGTNPSERCYLNIHALSSSNLTYRAHVMLIYYVECFDPVMLPQS